MSSRHAFMVGIGLIGVVVLAACSGDPSQASSPTFYTAAPDASAAPAPGESTSSRARL